MMVDSPLGVDFLAYFKCNFLNLIFDISVFIIEYSYKYLFHAVRIRRRPPPAPHPSLPPIPTGEGLGEGLRQGARRRGRGSRRRTPHRPAPAPPLRRGAVRDPGPGGGE